ASEDGNLTLRVDGDARRLAEIHVGRKLQEIHVAIERNFRNVLLRPDWCATRERGQTSGHAQRHNPLLHGPLLIQGGEYSSQLRSVGSACLKASPRRTQRTRRLRSHSSRRSTNKQRDTRGSSDRRPAMLAASPLRTGPLRLALRRQPRQDSALRALRRVRDTGIHGQADFTNARTAGDALCLRWATAMTVRSAVCLSGRQTTSLTPSSAADFGRSDTPHPAATSATTA